MTSTDYLVLSIYLGCTLFVGVALSLRNKSAAEMFVAGGQSPWWLAGLSGFMTMFSAATFTVWGGIAYEHGMVAVAINLCYGVSALLVGYFVAGRWKVLGIETPGQFINLRYGSVALLFYTCLMMAFKVIGMSVALYSLSVMLVEQMPLAEVNPLRDQESGNMSLRWAIILFGGVVIVYTMIGGLWGVLMTDTLQFIVLNLALLFVVPLMIVRAGGAAAIVANAPNGFLSPVSGDYTAFFLGGWIAVHYFVIGAEWAFVQRYLCVPTAHDARMGAYLFGVLYLVSPMLWLLPPMIQGVLEPVPAGLDPTAQRAFAERAYIRACESVLPSGMMGLMLAAMFSATASMLSSQLNVFAGVLTNDICKPLIRRVAYESRLVWVGRLFTALLGMVVITIALSVPALGGARNVVITAASLMVGPLLAPTIWGLFQRRVTQHAVWWTAGVCIVAGFLVKFGLAGGGWLAGIKWIEPICVWSEANPHTVDIVLGVVLPVMVLCIVQAFSHGTSSGWERVNALPRPQSNSTRLPLNRAPALLIGGSLVACGCLMAILGWINPSGDRRILLSFASVSSLLGTSIIFAMRRPRTAASHES